jgi:hypothetical protein
MNNRLVRGLVLAPAAGVIIAAEILIVAAPRLPGLLNATPGPTRHHPAGPTGRRKPLRC